VYVELDWIQQQHNNNAVVEKVTVGVAPSLTAQQRQQKEASAVNSWRSAGWKWSESQAIQHSASQGVNSAWSIFKVNTRSNATYWRHQRL